MGRLSQEQKLNKIAIYDITVKQRQRIKKQEEKRKELDQRYTSIVSVIYNEIAKREIDIKKCNTKEFNSKIDELIETILSTSVYKKFREDNIVDIRNAVKRRINNELNIQSKLEEGPEL